jgi:hypothetical protein
MKRCLTIASFIVALMPCASFSGDYANLQKLTGKFYLSGKNPLDPPSGEIKDSHFNLYLTGASAKTLFEAMKTEAVLISKICAEAEANDKTMAKGVGSMLCTEKPNKEAYECWFSIDIKNQLVDSTWVC